ncbi:MAG TPA: hypothetical protein VG651_09325 [Stellaceae bacterium]|nr:hypothetical protein [Stellaceae bacterium]
MSASYGTPVVDTVVLPAPKSIPGGAVTVHVSSELMKNQQSASPIEPGKSILVAQDNSGRPLIFTIGPDRHLRLLSSDSGSVSGWAVSELSAGLTGYDAVTAFDVTEDAKGRISVAFAAKRAAAAGSDIFVAPLLDTASAGPDWSKFAALSHRVAGIDQGFVPEQIRMGASDDDGAPLVIVSGNIAGRKVYYRASGVGAAAVELEFPENVNPDDDGLLALSCGHAFGQRGIFFLYKIGDTQTLECATLADAKEGSQHYDYSPDNPQVQPVLGGQRYNCIATAHGGGPSSDLYVGTDRGVYVFLNASARALQKVTERLKDVREILVRQDSDNISLWVLCSPNRLYYVYGKKGPTIDWHPPILFKDGVVHIAPLRNRRRQANELFLVDQDLNLVHFWQDPVHTLWQQRLMKAPHGNYLLDFASYTTQLHFADANGNGLAAQPLRITAAEWMYVVVNGRTYILDRDNPATVATDVMANVTIVAMAADMSTPILHVESDLFDNILNIYANGKVAKGLGAIHSGDDLRQERTQDHKPVLAAGVGPSTADGVAAQIGQLTTAGGSLVDGKRVGANIFVAVDDKKHSGRLRSVDLPGDFVLGMRLVDSVWEPHAAARLGEHGPGGIVDDFTEFAGDALHWLDTAFVAFVDGVKLIEEGVTYLKDGVSFVIHKIDDGLQFVLTLPGRIVNIALKSLGAIFRVLGWVLKLVGIALKDLLAWLGHLFGWDDIWETHKVIAKMMTNGLDTFARHITSELEGWRAALRTEFNKIEQQLDRLAATDSLRGLGFRNTANAGDGGQNSSVLHSPPANWSFYQIQHGGLLDGGGAFETLAAAPAGSDPLLQFVTETAIPTLTKLGSDVGKDASDLKRLLSDGGASVADIVKFAADLAKTAVEPAALLFDGFVQLLEGLLSVFRQALEDDLDIPFLSDFYELVTDLLTDGDGERLTGINGTALLLAIPLTIACKAATGEAPFHSGRFGLSDSTLFDRLIAGLEGEAPHDRAPRALPGIAGGFTYTATARKYAHIGGMAASIAGIAGTLINVFTSAGWKWKPLPIIQFACGVCKYACTFPLKPPADDTAAEVSYGFRLAAYTGGALNVFAQGVVALVATLRNCPAPVTDTWKGGWTIGCDALVFTAACVSDAINTVEAGGRVMTGLSLVPDILSNGGGVIMGIGQASPPGSEVRLYALPGGAAFALVGAGIAFAVALAALIIDNERNLFQPLNPGG